MQDVDGRESDDGHCWGFEPEVVEAAAASPEPEGQEGTVETKRAGFALREGFDEDGDPSWHPEVEPIMRCRLRVTNVSEPLGQR